MKNSSPTNNFSLKKNKKLRTVFFFFGTYLLLYSQLPNTRSQITCHFPFSLFPPIRNISSLGLLILFTKTFPSSLFITPLFYNLYSFFFIHHSPILQSLFLLLLIWWSLRVLTMCAIGWGNLKICLNFKLLLGLY